MVDEEPKRLNRMEVMRALRLAKIEVAFNTVAMTLVGGVFITGFALWLGANYFWIGLLSALPALCFLVNFPGAVWADRYASRKMFSLRAAFVERLWFILIIPIALFATHQPHPVSFSAPMLLLVIVLTLSALSGAMGTSAWLEWLTDLVPEDMRGRYFGSRNAISSVVSTALSLPAAWFLDYSIKSHFLSERAAFTILFTIGVICAWGMFFAMRKRPEQPRTLPVDTPNLRQSVDKLLAPFADEQFRRLTINNAVMAMAGGIIGPFVTVYMLQNLKLTYFDINLVGTVTGISSILTMTTWGYLADKYGYKPIIIISSVLVVIPPLLWMLALPGSPYLVTMSLLALINIIAGTAWAALSLNQFNMVIAISKEEERTMYFAAYTTVMGVTAFAAPLLGGMMMTALSQLDLNPVQRFQLMFLLSAVGRAFSLVWLRGVHEERASSASYVLSQIKDTRPAGWLALGRLSKGRSKKVRAEAALTLGETKTSLAVDELIQVLDDPSNAVRRQAAESLGMIGEAQAVPALIEKLSDEVAGIGDAAAAALGRIGDPSAAPALIEQLHHIDPAIREAAAAALGQVGAPHPIPLPTDSHPDWTLETISAMPCSQIVDLLQAPEPFVRANAAKALRDLNVKEAVPSLRKALKLESDPHALNTMAYALGWLGEPEDAALLLNQLAPCESDLARKRIALGIAYLWNVEEELYGLMALEGMARDTAVIKILQSQSKRLPTLTTALEAYAGGDYRLFIQTLSECLPNHAPLQLLTEYAHTDQSTQELCLLAAALIEGLEA
jgi:HEAT repeat protein/Na+/melibiose symporter-like transporter